MLLILTSYSTFLTSFLTDKRIPMPFKTMEELVDDKEYVFYTNRRDNVTGGLPLFAVSLTE